MFGFKGRPGGAPGADNQTGLSDSPFIFIGVKEEEEEEEGSLNTY